MVCTPPAQTHSIALPVQAPAQWRIREKEDEQKEDEQKEDEQDEQKEDTHLQCGEVK